MKAVDTPKKEMAPSTEGSAVKPITAYDLRERCSRPILPPMRVAVSDLEVKDFPRSYGRATRSDAPARPIPTSAGP